LSKQAFFYLSLNVGSLFSNSVLMFFEDMDRWWVVGFQVRPAGARRPPPPPQPRAAALAALHEKKEAIR
jgi:hypothetical protein